MRSLRASVSVINPVVNARLDTTGRFKFITELVAVVDGTAFVLSRPLTDIVAVDNDRVSVAALKFLADGFAMNDDSEAVDGSVYTLHKGIQNVTFPVDTLGHELQKSLQDAFGPQDAVAKSLSRPLADVFDLADDETVAALKGLSDSITMQDTLETLLLFIRDFDDTVSVPDVRATLFTPAVKVEQITVSDEDTISYLKNIADGFAMNDGSEAVDGSEYSIHKGISNVAFVADVRSLLFTLFRVESVSVADAGLVSATNYCDPTYFAEDFVGVSESF